MSDRTAIVTGGTSGIGEAVSLGLAASGYRVVILGRSVVRAGAVLQGVRGLGSDGDFIAVDLGSMESIAMAAEQLLEASSSIDALVNNAGVGGRHGKTADGFELAFGTNHLGHYLLTRLLLQRLVDSATARVVNVTSSAHYGAKGISWGRLRRRTTSLTGLREYRESKLCNVLFTRELGRRLADDGVAAYAVHPGLIATPAWPAYTRPFLRNALTPEEGADTILWCATDDAVGGETGLYYRRREAAEPSEAARDPELARELWERSEGWVEDFL